MPRISFEEFANSLDQSDQAQVEFLISMQGDQGKTDSTIFAKKGPDTLDLIRDFSKNGGYYPIVDKRLGFIFGVRHHLWLRAELYRYHTGWYVEMDDETCLSPHECADRWVSEGYGYFISSMQPTHIIVARKYRPDRFDKDVFHFYKQNWYPH